MLYSKTWVKPVKTPEQLMDLPSIIEWLEQRQGDRSYSYRSRHNCLLAQYYKDHGYEDVKVTSSYVCPHGRYSLYEGPVVMIPDEIKGTIFGVRTYFFLRETFKGALKRARRLVQQEQAYAL